MLRNYICLTSNVASKDTEFWDPTAQRMSIRVRETTIDQLCSAMVFFFSSHYFCAQAVVPFPLSQGRTNM